MAPPGSPGNDMGVRDDEVRGDRPTAPLLDAVARLPLDLDRRGRDEPETERSSGSRNGGLPTFLAGTITLKTCGNPSSPTRRRRA